MNAAPDAHFFVLLVHLREARELPGQACVGDVGGDKAFRPFAENGFQNTDLTGLF